MPSSQSYPTALNAPAWQLLAPPLPAAQPGGRPKEEPKRDRSRRSCRAGVPAVRGGGSPTLGRRGAWSIPPFGAGVQMAPGHGATRRCGATSGGGLRARPPRAALVAAQSGKTPARGGAPGGERAQKVNGRKRPSRGATRGWLRAVVGTAANGQDRDGAKQRWPLLRHGCPACAAGGQWVPLVEGRTDVWRLWNVSTVAQGLGVPYRHQRSRA